MYESRYWHRLSNGVLQSTEKWITGTLFTFSPENQPVMVNLGNTALEVEDQQTYVGVTFDYKNDMEAVYNISWSKIRHHEQTGWNKMGCKWKKNIGENGCPHHNMDLAHGWHQQKWITRPVTKFRSRH